MRLWATENDYIRDVLLVLAGHDMSEHDLCDIWQTYIPEWLITWRQVGQADILVSFECDGHGWLKSKNMGILNFDDEGFASRNPLKQSTRHPSVTRLGAGRAVLLNIMRNITFARWRYYGVAKSLLFKFFASISVSTRACHARKLGSTPRQRVFAFFPTVFILSRIQTVRTAGSNRSECELK